MLKRILKAGAVAALLAGGLSTQTIGAELPSIVPLPLSINQQDGSFTITPSTRIGYSKGLKAQADILRDRFWKSAGMDLACSETTRGAGIQLIIDAAKVPAEEGYTLSVTPKGIIITGHDAGGVYYGIQTLLQLLPADVYSSSPSRGLEFKVDAITVSDAPARPWRGMMLDVARYYYDKEFVKKYIAMMATYKLNKLQLHLIDDSGWRLEIKKYPRLTEVGAWAGSDTKRLGGFYTQDDIREILDYAAARNVEIIPEIEFPAHILSAVVAYPELSCTGEQHEMPVQHFISRDLLCAGKQSSIDFLSDVLDETVELFPSKYINIGGDEAVYDRYEKCPDCQALMKKLGLNKASELQGYLTNVVADLMAKKGRTVVGWEEIIQRGKVSKPVTALIWHNVADSIQATETGHKAILTPATHMYLDFPESSTPGEIKAATWMPPISLEKCYSMPVNDYSPSSTVLGVQGCFWSDQFIHGTLLQELNQIDENRSENYAEYLTFPRLLAVSEVAWTPESHRNFEGFRDRMASQYPRLDRMGVTYRVPEPLIKDMKQVPDGVEFTLAPAVEGAEIRYTTDGSYPNVHSPVYTKPVTVASKDDFKAITVVSPTHYSLPIYFAVDYSAYEVYGKHAGEWKQLQIQPDKPATVKFDVTGKVNGDGDYEFTFIPTKGSNPLKLGSIRLLKRDEVMDNTDTNFESVAPGSHRTYLLTLNGFEAGTPFSIEIEAVGDGGNDTQGLLFVKKLD